MKSIYGFAAFVSFLLLITSSDLLFAAQRASSADKPKIGRLKVFGGDMLDTREMKGCFVIINAQQSASTNLIQSAVNLFLNEVPINHRIDTGSFDIHKPDLRGQATLFIIDDARYPMSLLAPEARWAVVNVAQLKCEKTPYFEARVHKETFRALALLAGAAGSKYDHCITGCVTKPEDLDNLAEIKMPVEMKDRFAKHLPGYGIVPGRKTTYLHACREGWAPAPTNEFQKAIWEKVHAIPDKPIKIRYGKGKQKPAVK